MNYSKEAIEKLTDFIHKDSADTFNWLVNNGYTELAMLKDAVLGDGKSLEWLMRNKKIHLAAFVNAVREDTKAFDILFKLKVFHWAATANIINGDDKAAGWLKVNKLDHYILLALVMKEKIRRDSDDDFNESMMKVGSPF